MTDLIPTKEQYNQWKSDWSAIRVDKRGDIGHYLVIRAAQWGADQELEACRDWVSFHHWSSTAERLRNARRPKPPSEAEQALETLSWIESEASYDKPMFDTIRRALERLKELEEIK
jgi:hypothetical protein